MNPIVLSFVGLALAFLLMFVAAHRIRKEGLVPAFAPAVSRATSVAKHRPLAFFDGALLLVDEQGRNGRALVNFGGRHVRAVVRGHSPGGKHVRVASLRRDRSRHRFNLTVPVAGQMPHGALGRN